MSLENIKIIFFDIDGTLIDINSKKISERTLKTLNRLKERNYILCLSTGRSPVTVPGCKINCKKCRLDQQTRIGCHIE